MIAERPWIGCGPGNFQDTYTAYKLPAASEEVTDPHNFLLEVWATAGMPAMLALLAMLAAFAWDVRRLSRSQGTVPFSSNENWDSPRVIRRAMEPASAGDGAMPVFAGCLAGFVLAVPLGQLCAAPPSPAATLLGLPLPAATLLGLPLAAGSLILLAPWAQNGRLPLALPAIGVAVMLVNLLAAGGIGQPGVAGSFWLLLTLALNGQGLRVLPRPAAVAMLAFAVVADGRVLSERLSPGAAMPGPLASGRTGAF